MQAAILTIKRIAQPHTNKKINKCKIKKLYNSVLLSIKNTYTPCIPHVQNVRVFFSPELWLIDRKIDIRKCRNLNLYNTQTPWGWQKWFVCFVGVYVCVYEDRREGMAGKGGKGRTYLSPVQRSSAMSEVGADRRHPMSRNDVRTLISFFVASAGKPHTKHDNVNRWNNIY